MRILTFDVGKKSTGVALCVDSKITSSIHFPFKSHLQYKKAVDKLIDSCNPEVIGTSKPSRYYHTIYAHAQMIAIIELSAEERGVSVFKLYDREFKAWAFPKQKKIEKQEVIDKFGGTTDDEADARMFAMYLDVKLEEEK